MSERLDKKVEIAPVRKIIPFSSVDGPGNRTAIFLQGCNIDCKYCHNPETREIVTRVSEAEAEKSKGSDGGDITWMTTDQVIDRVKKQIPFIRGITVSGGECMLHPKFLEEIFSKARGLGLTTLIDSNGTIDFQHFSGLLELTDGVMLDIKAFEDREHIAITGHSNQVVLKNARYLAENNKLEEIRCVICPSLYDGRKSVEAIGRFMKDLYQPGAFHFKLISYRPMGVRREYEHMLTPGTDYMNGLKTILKGMGFEDTVVV